MHYLDHAKISARKFGGKPEDYVHLYRLIDSSKHHLPHWMHRIFSHNTWFVSVIDELVGPTITNSDGKQVSVRDILHEHLREDHDGKCPTIQDWTRCLKMDTTERWINRPDPKELHWLNKLNQGTHEQQSAVDRVPG